LLVALGLSLPAAAPAQMDAAGRRDPTSAPAEAEAPSKDAPGSARADSIRPWYRQPRWIMLRSVAVPGWGQWANGKHLKAGVVALGEGYLLFRAVDWGRVEGDAKNLARRHADDPALAAFYRSEEDKAASHRRDFTWWSIFAAALSMGDAYVDAQLGNFDVEFRPQDQAAVPARAKGPSMSVALRWNLP